MTTTLKTLGGQVIVQVSYPVASGGFTPRTLALSPATGSDGRPTKRPYREVYFGRHRGLTEEGAKRVFAELDFDVCEGNATLVEINDRLAADLK